MAWNFFLVIPEPNRLVDTLNRSQSLADRLAESVRGLMLFSQGHEDRKPTFCQHFQGFRLRVTTWEVECVLPTCQQAFGTYWERVRARWVRLLLEKVSMASEGSNCVQITVQNNQNRDFKVTKSGQDTENTDRMILCVLGTQKWPRNPSICVSQSVIEMSTRGTWWIRSRSWSVGSCGDS